MANVTVSIGPMEGLYTYDDTKLYSDGVPMYGMKIDQAPTDPSHVARKQEIDTLDGLLNNESFIVVSLSGDLTNERVFAVANGIKKTDGGANGNFTVEIDATAKPTMAGSTNTDHVDVDADSKALRLGADQDATLLYDGTDLLINPKAVGSGKMTVQGVVNTTESYQVDGTKVVGNQEAAITPLTDNTTGTSTTQLVDVTTAALADPAKINDNFASLLAKLEAYATVLRNHGLLAT